MVYDPNAQGWTAAQLLSDVRRKASLPVTSGDFPDAVLLREATDVLWSFAGWAVSQGGEGRLLSSLTRSVVSASLSSSYRSASEFLLPPLAVADTVENVTWVDSTGQNQSRLARLESAEESDYDSPTKTGDPAAYALFDGRIRIYPQPTTGGVLRIAYQRRHPDLILDAAPAVVTVVSNVPGTTSVDFTVNATTNLVNGDEVDLISPNAPYRYVTMAANVNNVVGTTLTIVITPSWITGWPTGLRITRAGGSPYVHFPMELRASVTEKITANVLRILGDMQGMQAAELAAKEELSRVMQMLSPRAKRDKPKAVNPYSHMRSGVIRNRRW